MKHTKTIQKLSGRYRKPVGEKVFIAIVGTILLIYCLSLCFPILWGLNAATMTERAYFENPFAIDGRHTLENFGSVWEKLKITIKVAGQPQKLYDIGTMLTYTLTLALGKPTIVIFFTTAMAYCLSRLKFRGSKFLYNFGIVLMILPIFGSFGASMKLAKDLGIYNNLLGNILTAPVGCFSGMTFLMLYNAFKRIPMAYTEAAKIDGANDFYIYYRIMLPMVFSNCVVYWLLAFLGTWNDYQASLIWLPSYPTVAYGMWIFQDQVAVYGSSVPEILAGFLMMSVPLALLITFTKNLITEKMQVGGLKG